MRPEGTNGISSIGPAEVFVVWQSSLIVGNKFENVVCELKASL